MFLTVSCMAALHMHCFAALTGRHSHASFFTCMTRTTGSSHVADEEAAQKADVMVADAKAKLEAANLPGYTKVVRTVCKAEWAYEVRLLVHSG